MQFHSIYPPFHSANPSVYISVYNNEDMKRKKNLNDKKCMSMCTECTHTPCVYKGLTAMPYALIQSVFGGCCLVKSQFSSQSVMHYIRSYTYRLQLPHFESLTAAFMWSMNFDGCINTYMHALTYTHYSHHPVQCITYIFE